jgi:hypothetical protein
MSNATPSGAVDPPSSEVLRWNCADQASVRRLLAAFGLRIEEVEAVTDIPGSYWGDEEAGLVGSAVHSGMRRMRSKAFRRCAAPPASS